MNDDVLLNIVFTWQFWVAFLVCCTIIVGLFIFFAKLDAWILKQVKMQDALERRHK